MKKKMTFDEWVRNPSESRSRIVGEKDIAKNVYNEKYNKMILLTGGKIDYYLFHEDTKRYIIYIKVPSDSIKSLTYDVVIEFSTEMEVKRRLNNLNGYNVKFFSNDPNFIFTYAYTYNKNGLLIPYLKNKINSKALSEKPKTTNPNTLVGYVKSIYFAYIFMSNKGLFNKLNWLQAGSINQMSQVLHSSIVHSDVKLKQVEDLKKVQRAGVKIKNVNDTVTLDKTAKNVTNVSTYVKKLNKIDKANRARTAKSALRAKKARKV